MHDFTPPPQDPATNCDTSDRTQSGDLHVLIERKSRELGRSDEPTASPATMEGQPA